LENLHRHELRSVVVDGAECFIEGLGVTDDGPYAVFLAHATVGEDGLITRYMAMFTERRPPASPSESAVSSDPTQSDAEEDPACSHES
jgi:hypothetical protein